MPGPHSPQSPTDWHDDLPERSLAATFRSLVDHHLRRFPEIDIAAERFHSREPHEMGIRFPTASGGSLTVRFPLSAEALAAFRMPDNTELHTDIAFRHLATALSATLLLARALPPEAQGNVDLGSHQITVTGRSWGPLEAALHSVGAPPQLIIERDGASTLTAKLPGDNIDVVRAMFIAGRRGAAMEFFTKAATDVELLVSPPPEEEREIRAQYRDELIESLNQQIKHDYHHLFERITDSMSSFEALPTVWVIDESRSDYYMSEGRAASLQVPLQPNEVAIFSWNEITKDVRVEMIRFSLLDFTPSQTSLRLVPNLHTLPPGERAAQRVHVFIGPMDLAEPIPEQFVDPHDRLRGFAPDLTPDPNTETGRHELVEQRLKNDLFSGAGISAGQVSIHRYGGELEALRLIQFNSVTGGIAVEINTNVDDNDDR